MPSARLRLLLAVVMAGTVATPAGQAQQAGSASQHPVTLLQALNSVLTYHPLLSVQQAQVEIARSLRLQASSPFNTVLTADALQSRSNVPLTAAQQQQYSLINANGSSQQANTSSVSAGVSRLFRSGIQLSASVPVLRSTDNLLAPNGTNTAQPVLQLVIPLLRGRGRSVVAAAETAATVEVEAATYDLTQQITQLVTTAAADYRTLAAAQKLLLIGRDAEERTRLDLENAQTLVDADQIPRSNLNEVNANLAQARQTRTVLEQNLLAAQFQLANDMGVAAADVIRLRPQATEDLPPTQTADLPVGSDAALLGYVSRALHLRSDYLATQKRIVEQGLLVTAARNQLLPAVNLAGSTGYNGLREGRGFTDLLGSTASSVQQPNASFGVNYNFAPRNDYAHGLLLQAQALEQQRKEQSEEVARSISRAVGVAVEAVRHGRQAAQEAGTAVTAYEASLSGQRDKFHLGLASVVDLITVENNLTLAKTNEVQAQLSFALALIQLRYATGTILQAGAGVQQIDPAIFRTLPPGGDENP